MIEQHELALTVLAWVGFLALPCTYLGIWIATVVTDRSEARRALAPSNNEVSGDK